jgi:hypothetical protein
VTRNVGDSPFSDLGVQVAHRFFGDLGRHRSLAAPLENACGTCKQRPFP